MADRPSQALLNAQKELEKRRQLAGVSYLPPRQTRLGQFDATWLRQPVETLLPAEVDKNTPAPLIDPGSNQAVVRVAPSLAAWCLDKDHRYRKHSLDGPYRLYKILQVLDQKGRGWLTNLFVEATLTNKKSRYYIYGRRQLKNMLSRGEGLFWRRAKSKGELRIRLISRAKVASQLLATRLRGQEVHIPLRHMLGHGRGRQAAVNAALYAAVHAGQIQRQGKSTPISRARLRDVSGCSDYRQRQYERRMGITITHHIHVLGRYNEYNFQRTRLTQGLPTYRHIDYLGKINRHQRGADYIARRLPNSYHVPSTFAVIHSRRQRTMNRHLVGLCHMGSEGSDRSKYVRLFQDNVTAAVQSSDRNPNTTVFWAVAKGSRSQLWLAVA